MDSQRTCLLMLLLAALVACSSGTVPDEDGGGVSCGDCPCVGDLTIEAPQATICSISGTLTESANLPLLADRDWFIVNSITVESGTLTIDAGVKIFASRDTLTSDPEYIYVAPGASIRAIGTADNPIIFSSNDSDYALDTSVNSADGWSGLIIDTGSAAGSSRLEYVIVAEAGLETNVTSGPQNVSAAITLLGRHENTIIKNVQVHDTVGDGIHIDGESLGNVTRMESILITAAGRDGIYYEDFSGLIKDALIVHEAGAYSTTTNRGGRAGIRAGGTDSLPLIVGATLVGNDGTTESGSGSREYGLLVESSADQIRLVNSLLLNFKNGCYDISGGADLSTADIANAPLGSFVDGVHCVVESNGGADIGDAPAGDDLADIGNGNGAGFRFYNGASIQYNSVASPVFSEAWRIETISSIGLLNAPNPDSSDVPIPCVTGITTHLCLNNDGDTDNDGLLQSSDLNAGRFMNDAGDPLFDGVDAAGKFDLTEIGAVRSSNLNVFNGWTLQSGAVSPAVDGFLP